MSDKREIVNELHRAARKNFPRTPFQMRGIDDTFQIDLIEFIPYATENRGFKYALVVIDTFSKYAWTVPLKNKTGAEVTKAMNSIFDKSGRVPKNCQSDNGKEFYNNHFAALMRKYNINHYSTFSKLKASICERLNRTLLYKLWKHFSLCGKHKWIYILQDVTDEYNNTKHRTIKMKPVEVRRSHEQYLLTNVYKQNSSLNATETIKLSVSDNVRISKYKNVFEKGYTPNWTTEIFVVDKILQTNPTTYKLKDLNGVDIQGRFYYHELQKTAAVDVYLVERIMQRKGNKCFVKWLGFDDSFNSWINKDDIL